MYLYFVSYFFKDGYANGVFALSEKLDNMENITAVQRKIEHDNGINEVAIMNFQILKESIILE